MKKLLLILLCTSFSFAQPSINTPNNLFVCDANNDGFATFDLSVNTTATLNGLDPNEHEVSYHKTFEDSSFALNPINAITAYENTSPHTETIYVRVSQISTPTNFAVTEFTINTLSTPQTSPISAVIFDTDGINDNITTLNLTSFNSQILDVLPPESYTITFHYSIIDATAGYPNISLPTNFTTVSQIIYYRVTSIVNDCYSIDKIMITVLPEDYETPAPIGITEQTFTEGETLADIEIEGENIQWYDNSGEGNDFIFTPKNGELPLPLTTTLVDETTYYASQTIYNIESDKRLAVTVLKTLGAKDNQFTGMAYYPNPVKNDLTIINSNEIETVSIVNMLGQTIANKQINSTTAQIDLSSLQSGMYIINIRSGSKNKIIKIIKE